MNKDIPHLPNSELELMMIIWEANEPVTRADIEAKLEGHDNWGPTTVLKFLSRLVEKGFIHCESQGWRQMNRYSPIITENEYLESESSSVFGRFVGRSVTNVVANLYKNKSIDDSELDELQAFIDAAKGRQK